MNRRRFIQLLSGSLVAVASCSAPVVPATPGPSPSGGTPAPLVEGRVNGYTAVAPRVLRAGQSESVAVALLYGRNPASGTVKVSLVKDGKSLAQKTGVVQGHGQLVLDVPQLAEGEYKLQVATQSFQGEANVRVEEGTLVFLETDKPIYKPGQTIHIRLLTVDPALRPVPAAVTVEVMEAKGLKVFKKDVDTDDFGMASLDLPLSSEPNLGTWKVSATTGKRSVQLDVRVERYVLPKYEVNVDLPKDWVLASEPIKGKVSAEYSYGKPVTGEVVIKASRYVGTWQEYAEVTRNLAGDTVDFDLPAVQYVSGVPGAKGLGNVQLDVAVKEKSTGYEEKTSRLLRVAADAVTLQVIPDSVTFKPGLPLNLLLLAETPDRQPVDAQVQLNFNYMKKGFNSSQELQNVAVKGGKALVKVTPPADTISVNISANAGNAWTNVMLQAGYSPSGSFIHLEQVSQGTPKVGDTARFKVTSTKEAANFYYEVVARGKVVFSDYSRSPELAFTVTPLMAPSGRLLVYQILQTSEVAADYLPFSASGDYPHKVTAAFDRDEAKPGEEVDVNIQTEGEAKVGLVAVDRSVFILAENRLNLQQVFDELERLYQKPQVELHEARPLDKITLRGAKDVFQDAGVVVLSNMNVPAGQEIENPMMLRQAMPGMAAAGAAEDAAKVAVPAAAPAPMGTPVPTAQGAGGLAEVQRVRQFFPETWIWQEATTDASGKAQQRFTTPDSITTWMLRAVALSKVAGLGIAEAQLKVMQPFFVTIDLPYATIRGEEFPVKVALYNYTDRAQEYQVDLEGADWFDLLEGQSRQSVRVGANDLGGASFTIRPRQLGTRQVKVTARSSETADAIVKDIIVEPEGVAREQVENLVIAAGARKDLTLALPNQIIEGSARAFVALTGNYLTQSIQGLEKLLQMPFGCGEQNMVLFAPNVFVARYLKETGQMKPEVMAKAENMMITGYQRELTYRRGDASFSAFGNQDKDGSLWLTAFVLKTFAQATDQIYIDETVIGSAKDWIVQQQRPDGSFDPVGFVHHQEMLGGLKGKAALTAYVTIALKEAKEEAAVAKAVRYLEGEIDKTNDPYAVAIITYALELAKSGKANAAHAKLVGLAKESEDGLYWGDDVRPLPAGEVQPGAPGAPIRPGLIMPDRNPSATIETTAYATLALIEHNDKLTAGRAARWLVSQRNSYGGFGSTQDTVVGLQALTRFAADSRSDVDATVSLRGQDWQKDVRVEPANADVLQLVEAPAGGNLVAEVKGKGQVVLQTVLRYNVPEPQAKLQSAFQIDVTYDVEQVAVNDLITITADVTFTPPEPMQAGMVVLDLAVPTGFAPETDSLEVVAQAEAKVKRFDVAGRKVIFYIEDMLPDETIRLSFQARALYPVKAQAVTSQAYAYYRPEWKGESLGSAVVVR